ncbi:MAG: arylamine N-acetyltransferase [Lachnospiraceae bacterium]
MNEYKNQKISGDDTMLDHEQMKQYMQRIKYDKPLTPDLATLSALQQSHLEHIPYENLNILAGIPLSLKPDDLFEKIILRNRGGYCFELQGLYKELLESIGFQVMQYAGRFMDEPGVVQMRRHRVLVVQLDGMRYLVDVGVRNESPRIPIKLIADEIQFDGISHYKFQIDPFYGWSLYRKEKGKDWKPTYGFTEEPQIDDDYIMPSFYCEKHPESTFNKFMKISIFSGESNYTLVDGVFKEYRSAKVQVRKILESAEETRIILKEYFGLDWDNKNL